MSKVILKPILVFLILVQFINGNIDLTENKIGEINGYFYELWNADNIGKAKMSIDENNFICSWKNIESVVFQFGKNFKPQKSLDELGNVIMNFEVEMDSEGYAYAGVNGYGSPYEIFYIIEDYSDKYVPPSTSLGTVTIDDGEYDIYYKETILPPNIYGYSKQFEYWNIRKEKRKKGKISFNKHFESWKQKKCQFELISRIAFIVEGFKSTDNAKMNNLGIKLDTKLYC